MYVWPLSLWQICCHGYINQILYYIYVTMCVCTYVINDNHIYTKYIGTIIEIM
jgi:hypothetical protein